MAEQDRKTGQITIIAKNIKETARGSFLVEAKNIHNTAGGKFYQSGKNGGVHHGKNQPRKPLSSLLVTKVEGPFDENNKKVDIIEKGKKYNYKVAQYSRTPTKEELKNLKWGIKFDDGAIMPAPKVTGVEKISYFVANEYQISKLKVYAYFKTPSEMVSVEVNIEQQEVLIVVGTEQHSESYGNKLMFPAQAVREIKENYKDNNVNIIIFKDQYTAMQLSIIKRDAKKWNSNLYFKQINSVNDLINYINNGDATIDRKKLKIGTIKIFSHGLPSVLDFGLDGKNEKLQRFKIEHINQLKKESFVKHPLIYSYACRTGNSDSRLVASADGYKYDSESIKLVKPEESLAQKLAEYLDAKVYAYLKRSNYTSSWLDGGDKSYTKDYMTIEDEEVSNPLNPKDWFRKGWDEALWNPAGAYLAPTSGNTPGGILEGGMFIFEKGKKERKE